MFAAEISRFCSAAVETSIGISQEMVPKSTAWLLIRTYYSAFYAAHCLLRVAGISASNLYADECQRADAVANALGFSNAPLEAAQYRCVYLFAQNRLECTKAHGRGIHEQLWRVFGSFLHQATDGVLRDQSLLTQDAQTIFARLDELRQVLKRDGHGSGSNWLSTVRNDVTYRQQHQAWFPFGRSKADCNRLFSLQKDWRRAPEEISLQPSKADEIEVFVRTCAFLVALAVEVVQDMAQRNSNKRSFLLEGPIKLLRQFSIAR
jgi:hypothetical protein